MTPTVAAVREATVVIKNRRVLGPVSFSVRTGEHWALIGPNGAGKTTLLRLLGAQRRPTSGAVELLGGGSGGDLRELRRKIGTVGHAISDELATSATALEVVLTGRDGLLAPYWGVFSEVDRIRAHSALGRLRAGALADQVFSACSQGERARVLLARSLFGDPELLLLDEPALGMDLPGREAIVVALDELAANPHGPATVQVAHTLEELPSSISHALLLSEGKAISCGEVDDVLSEETLLACFHAKFRYERDGGRFRAWADSSW